MHRKGFAVVEILVAVVVIGVIIGAFILLKPPQESASVGVLDTVETNDATPQQNTSHSSLPQCKNDPLFTTLPMELENFLAFRPLGFTAPPIHVFPAKHSNFAISKPGEEWAVHEVVFPADVWVTTIITQEYIGKGRIGYQLYFQPCEEFKAYFYHLSGISEKLLTELENSGPSKQQCAEYSAGMNTMVKRCQHHTHIEVAAGELAGYSGDGAGVDFGAVDFRIEPLPFAEQSKYSEELLHYVSPVDYFVPEVKQLFESKLASYDGSIKRTIEPLVGSIAQDIKGTAQGNWFPPGLNWATPPFPDPAPFIALVHDYVNPNQPIFSIGTSIKGVNSGLYSFEVQNTGMINRDFKDVKANNTLYCFNDFKNGKTQGQINLATLSGIILVKLPNTNTLSVEYQAGKDCLDSNLALTSNTTTFER